MADISLLLKKLSLLGEVCSAKVHLSSKMLYETVECGDIVYISGTFEEYEHTYTASASNEEDRIRIDSDFRNCQSLWAVYDDSTDFALKLKSSDQHLAVIGIEMWSATVHGGAKDDLRWRAEFSLHSEEILAKFEDLILMKFDVYLEHQYQLHLDELKAQWKAEREHALLGDDLSDDPLSSNRDPQESYAHMGRTP